VLERFVEDVDDEEFAEFSFDEEGNDDEIDKKCSEFREINEDVLIPESMVGLADFLDIW
jgi:hypothetical protein